MLLHKEFARVARKNGRKLAIIDRYAGRELTYSEALIASIVLGNKIKIEFAPLDVNLHYNITPYHFSPKVAKKYISNFYLDFGQGLFQCLKDIYKEVHPRYKELNGILALNDSD